MDDRHKLFHRDSYPILVSDGRDLGAGHQRGNRLEYGSLIEHTLSEDLIFREAATASRDRGSLLSDHKLANLYLIIRYAMPEDATCIFEFGSYMGGSAVFMATILKRLGRPGKVFAFDTFAGMPETDPVRDLHRAGDFADAQYDGLVRYIADNGLADHVALVKGLFSATLPAVLSAGNRPSLLHIDCDIYEPVKYTINACLPYLTPASHIVLDDPLHGSCLGAFDAVQEVLIRRRKLTAEQAYPHLVFRYPPLPDPSAGWISRAINRLRATA